MPVWRTMKGSESTDPLDFKEEIGEAIIKHLTDNPGGCTVSKTANNFHVSDFMARTVWFANLHPDPAEPEE